MSEVVVGVKRVTKVGSLALPEEPADAAIGCMWVKVGSQVIRAEEGLISVEQRADVDFMKVVITLAVDSYRTVSHLEEP